MTNDQIRIAVAEECEYELKIIDGERWWHHNGRGKYEYNSLPNYPESLDACVEFEKNAPEDYWIDLWRIMLEHKAVMNEANLALFGKATPLQRCEAFLRLKGKWKD